MAATAGADDERPDSQRAQLNQDCLDIVVEFGATSLDVLTQLRTVGRAFDTAVRNLLLMMHRSSGVAMEVLNVASVGPLVGLLGEGAALPHRAFMLSVACRNADTLEHVCAADLRATAFPGGATCLKNLAAAVAGRFPSSLTALDLNNNGDVNDAGIDAVAESCTNLSTLMLRGTAVTDACFGAVSVLCPRLRTVDMCGAGAAATGAALRAIARRCRGIESVTLTVASSGPFDFDLEYLGKQCAELRHVAIRHTGEASQRSKDAAGAIAKMCVVANNLQSLRLECACDVTVASECKGNRAATDQELLDPIAKACPNLQCLVLHCAGVTDKGLGNVVKGCTQLTHLEVSNCRSVTDGTAFTVAENRPSLRNFRISSGAVTDAALLCIAVYCPNLQHLDVSGCLRVSDVGVKAIANRCGSSLRSLNLQTTSATNDTVFALGAQCRHLECLDVRNCSEVTDACLQAIAEGCPAIKRVSLSMCDVTAVSAYGFVNASRVSPLKAAVVPPAAAAAAAPTAAAPPPAPAAPSPAPAAPSLAPQAGVAWWGGAAAPAAGSVGPTTASRRGRSRGW